MRNLTSTFVAAGYCLVALSPDAREKKNPPRQQASTRSIARLMQFRGAPKNLRFRVVRMIAIRQLAMSCVTRRPVFEFIRFG